MPRPGASSQSRPPPLPSLGSGGGPAHQGTLRAPPWSPSSAESHLLAHGLSLSSPSQARTTSQSSVPPSYRQPQRAPGPPGTQPVVRISGCQQKLLSSQENVFRTALMSSCCLHVLLPTQHTPHTHPTQSTHTSLKEKQCPAGTFGACSARPCRRVPPLTTLLPLTPSTSLLRKGGGCHFPHKWGLSGK